MSATAVVTYRDLSQQDAESLTPILQQSGFCIAYTHLASPIVAEVDGKIVGFGIAQLLPHAQPIFVEPEWRGIGIAEEIAKRVVAKIALTGAKYFCCIATNPFSERLCEANGMHAIEGKLYVKD